MIILPSGAKLIPTAIVLRVRSAQSSHKDLRDLCIVTMLWSPSKYTVRLRTQQIGNKL